MKRSILMTGIGLAALAAYQAPDAQSAAADGGAKVTSITIQGLEFEAPQPYAAGTVELTPGEASALNQTLAENLRNNFAPKIKAAMEEYRKANNLAEDAEVPVANLDQDALIAQFNEYADKYEFGVRTAGGTRTPTDPVEREAMRIGRERVKAALNKKGIKIDSVSKEKMSELIQQVLSKYPDIKEEAKRRVDATASIALDGLDLSGAENSKPAAPAAPAQA